ncbi:MAG: SLBB domain-containing protein [Chitinophagaceae bacterium]|nr:SLBB domain-containing protein [Chitinophagaceae bacterium]MCW5905687.1 SLBB domain-containing protein [Chitinophagaceae bacterium]
MKRSIIFIICVLLSLPAISQSSLQELISSKDLSNFKVEMLKDEDIMKYRTYLQNAGVTEAQAEQLALQRGLPSSEILKLKARINSLAHANTLVTKPTAKGRTSAIKDADSLSSNTRIDTKEKSTIQPEDEIFGSELFTNNDLKFEPDLRIPTPKNYIIGPDDEVAIDVYGFQETNPRLTVSPEGFINIPNVGFVSVNGLTVEAATKRIKDKMMKNGYSRIANGQTKVEVSISKIRTIRVTVIGQAKKPGTYSVSSLSTIFNVLYAAGGPNDKGSLRTIELIRDNKVIATLDAYDFLLKGIQQNNIKLTDQDVVRIPAATVQVKLKGEIKRQGIFEMLPNENMNDLVGFAQGFTGKAYTASASVERYTEKEKEMLDVKKTNFNTYTPNNGDIVTIGKVLERYSNRIVIDGAVYRPGHYELTSSLTLSQLIAKADGVKEDAYKERGLLYRINEDLSKQVIDFNLNNIETKKEADILLKKDDSIVIASAKDFYELYTLTVDGEVRKPGVYEYYKGITLKGLIFQTGGFTDAASAQRIEIARRIQGDITSSTAIAQVIEIATEKDLSIKGDEVVLQPWDVVIVRSNPGYKPQITVKVEGEVMYPGTYVLSSKEDNVSDIIKRAGGVTPQADNTGAFITRVNTSTFKDEAAERLQKLKKASDTSTQLIEELTKPTVKISLRLDEILNNKGNALENITLLEGDIISVPKQRNVVKVNGEVMFPTEIVYKEGASIHYYLDKAGGLTENARKKKIAVLNSNGSAAKTKKFLFFRTYPKVVAGSEILVPKVPEKQKQGLSTAEWLAVASGLASLAGVAVAIINVTR